MDKAKKKQAKKAITWALLAALVAGLAAMPLLAKEKAEADGPVASILSGTVETGSITTALHGGGTLSSEDVEDIQLPSGVKITEFLVKNGDFVAEGTPLAAVDSVSVMTAITEVTDTMEYLQEEIRNSTEEKVSSTVSATAGGRVKQVFAKQGDSVQDIMLEHGALAVLSLDGLMAVKLEKRMELPTGSSVTVTFEDDTEAEGRVESNLDGTIVVTVEDDNYVIGQKVFVTTDDGKRVGSGELYVHNAWSATAFSGTVQTVWAKEESKVSSGASLFTLTDTDFKAQLEYMSSLHREYEELLQDLFRMYNSGTIDAPCDGRISGVDEDSVHLLAAEEEDYALALLDNREETGWTLMLLSAVTYEEGACGSETCPLKGEHTVEDCPRNVCDHSLDCPANPDKHDSSCIFSCDHAETPEKCDGTGNHYKDCIKSCIHAKDTETCPATKHHYLTCVESCVPSDGTTLCPATGNHKKECIQSCTHADVADGCSATTHHYTDCILACKACDSGNQTCPASKHHANCYYYGMTYTATAAKLFSVGNELVVYPDLAEKVYTVEKSGSGWSVIGEQVNTQTLTGKPVSIPVANPETFKGKEGSILLIVTGKKGDETIYIGPVMYAAATNPPSSGTPNMGSMGDLSSMLGGLGGMTGMGGLSGFGNADFTAQVPVEENQLFPLEGSTLMTVSPESTVALTITLDEQDIAKVSVGQKASVKVLALSGETFEAEVVEVAGHGTNSGGSSKFTAKLRLAKTADMLDGMSATAALHLQSKDDIPLIPVAALIQQGTRTMVCTGLDKETGEPANPVPVTLGISDGSHVEILEGLKTGDSYYYSYYDTLELDTGVEDRFTLR